MNKKFGKLILVFCLFLSLMPLNAFANNEIKLWIDGNYVESDVAPFIEESRTLVPLRVISENLGLDVEWMPEEKQVIISQGEDYFVFLIGENFYSKGDLKMEMDAAPKIVDDRTFVPIRVIAELFNKEVNWDNANRTVVIGSGYNFTLQNKEVTPKKEEIKKAEKTLETNKVVENTENKKATNVNTLVGLPTGNGNGNNFNTYDIPTNAKYVGNSNSSKFHRGSCGSVNKIAPNNKVIFNTREEAINSGYQACKRCNP